MVYCTCNRFHNFSSYIMKNRPLAVVFLFLFIAGFFYPAHHTQATTEGVFWTSTVNVTATGNSIQKTGGCDGCADAGAVSLQSIASGDGYVEFTASELTTAR